MFFYSDRYYLEWLGHVFPVEKYKLTYERILAEQIATPDQIVQPLPPMRSQLELIHRPAYLDELQRLARQGVDAGSRFEAPLTEDILEAVVLSTGGTIDACRLALAPEGRGVAMNLSGGYHHAYPDHGEGFCFINDVAVAAATVLNEGLAHKVMIVDCDVHQGNGTARALASDDRVFTLDIHQERNYPHPKEEASLNISLPDSTDDAHYMQQLSGALAHHAASFAPDLIIYLAGGDPYLWDRLGGLSITRDGFVERDELVIRTAKDVHAGLAIVLAGGYPEDINDVVDIHVETARLAAAM